MTAPHPLDRPLWATLTGAWAALAAGDDAARRLDPDHGPFAACRDGGAADAAPWLPRDRETWFVESGPVAAPPGFSVTLVRELTQMVADEVPAPRGAPAFAPLGDADAAEMQALAALTRPGPFLARTHELGRFIGHREQGRLLAMAGTRMAAPGFIEVSGVCTHPMRRGAASRRKPAGWWRRRSWRAGRSPSSTPIPTMHRRYECMRRWAFGTGRSWY